MGAAFQCEHCGLFFPGLAQHRSLPHEKLRYDGTKRSETGYNFELCRKCVKEFDTDFSALVNKYWTDIVRNQKIKDDPGHEPGQEEIEEDEP